MAETPAHAGMPMSLGRSTILESRPNPSLQSFVKSGARAVGGQPTHRLWNRIRRARAQVPRSQVLQVRRRAFPPGSQRPEPERHRLLPNGG